MLGAGNPRLAKLVNVLLIDPVALNGHSICPLSAQIMETH